MALWTDEQATAYFESGGTVEPSPTAVVEPLPTEDVGGEPLSPNDESSSSTPPSAPAAGVVWPQNPDVTRYLDEYRETLAMLPPAIGDAGLRAMMRSDKAANMAKLKDLGVGLKERQALANTLGKGKRAAEGFGMPVLVVMYSAGVSSSAGRGLMRGFLA